MNTVQHSQIDGLKVTVIISAFAALFSLYALAIFGGIEL